jgi:hypothetical protein
MTVSFPTSKKTFTQIQDGVAYEEAVNINTAYDEIEAIQTLLGALGRAQGYSDSIKNLLKNYRRGCEVEYKDAVEIYVRSGEITLYDASGNSAFRVNTADTNVGWANIDTGSEANSTIYYVYAVADASGTTFTVVISTNATTPTGATYYKKIGSFNNNGSGDIDRWSVTNLEPSAFLGEWETMSNNTVYKAMTAGIVYANECSPSTTINIITDSSNPPTTTRQRAKYVNDYNEASASCVVRKDDFWKTTNAVTVYFIPLLTRRA